MLFIILGQYRYNDFQRVNRYLAPIFIISYVTLVGYGLVNLFLAIMTQSFDRLRQLYFDEYVGSEIKKKIQHEKTVGSDRQSVEQNNRNRNETGNSMNDQNHLAMTPWQALTSLVPLLKDVKSKVQGWYRG